MSGSNDNVKNKLIFTTEGRRLLVSQESGIKFAILGAVLIQGLEPVEPDDMFSTYKDITLQDLCNGYTKINSGDTEKTISGIVVGIKNVEYVSRDNDKIVPYDRDKYNATLSNLSKQDLLSTVYSVSNEVKDLKNSVYGTYDIAIDRTALTLSWSSVEHEKISFSHIGLIGKIFAETDDAVFNVDNTQRPVLVALAQICGKDPNTDEYLPGIQILQDQNVYTGIMLQLHMTVADHDFDFEASPGFDKDDEETQEILDISRKLSLVNNGLLTKPSEGVKMQLSFGSDEEVIEGLGLNENGNIATPKTLMVADAMTVADMSEQWNAAGMIHLVNKKDEDNSFKPQVVLTTIDQPVIDNTVDIPLYSVEMKLQGRDDEVSGEIQNSYVVIDNWGNPETRQNHKMVAETIPFSGNPDPLFNLGANPEQDDTAVSIFGLDNYFLNEVLNDIDPTDPNYRNRDKAIFSKNNVTTNPARIDRYSGYNAFFHSENNLLRETGANTDNTFIHSDHNVLRKGAYGNTFIAADSNNLYDEPHRNAIVNSRFNVISGENSFDNTIIGGHDNGLYNSKNITAIGAEGGFAIDVGLPQYILGTYNKCVPEARLIFGNGYSENARSNALEFYPDAGKLVLYNQNGDQTIAIGGDDGLSLDTLTLSSISANTISAGDVSASDAYFNSVHVKKYVVADPEQGATAMLFPNGLGLDVNAGFVGWYNGSTDPTTDTPIYQIKSNSINLNGLQYINNSTVGSYELTVGSTTTNANNVKLNNTNGSVFKYGGNNYVASYLSECDVDLYVNGTNINNFTVEIGDIRTSNPSQINTYRNYILSLINFCLIGYTDNDSDDGKINGDAVYYTSLEETQHVTGSGASDYLKFLDSAYKKPYYKINLPDMCQRINLNIYLINLNSGNSKHRPIITWLPFKAVDAVSKYGNAECNMNIYFEGALDGLEQKTYTWENKKSVHIGDTYTSATISDYVAFNASHSIYTGQFRQLRGKAALDWTSSSVSPSPYHFAPGFYASSIPFFNN